MLDFHEVNCEAKIRQNLVQIWETIKNKDMSHHVTMTQRIIPPGPVQVL